MQSEQMSAHQIDEEMKEEELKVELTRVQNEQLDEERDAIIANRKELALKYKPLAIDRVAVRDFF